MNTKTIALQTLATIMLLATTHSAFALSCARVDPVKQCQMMQTEKKSPVLINGQLQLKKIISQETREGNIGGKGPTVAEYRFTGNLSDMKGKRAVKNAKIIISTSCAGPWCANLPASNKSGVFLLKGGTKAGLKLHLGACSFQPMAVTDQQTKALEACVTPKPVKPPVVQNTGSSQVYTQRNKDKKLVQ